jgi:hypothetical protein
MAAFSCSQALVVKLLLDKVLIVVIRRVLLLL